MSVVIDLTINDWVAGKVETAYASGAGTTPLDETILTQPDLSAIDRVTSIEIEYAAYEEEEEFDIGNNGGLYPDAIQALGKGPGKLTLIEYLQTDDNYDLAISGDMGEIGNSMCYHVFLGSKHLEFFGCVVMSHKLEAVAKKVTKQTTEYQFRNQKNGSALNKVAYTASAVSTFVNVSFTIDSHTSADLKAHTITQTITNTRLESEDAFCLGDEAIQLPALIKREVITDIGYKVRDSNTWGAGYEDVATADEIIAASFFPNVIIWHTTLTSTMANVYVPKNGTNSGVHSEHGMLRHTAQFKQGVGFTIA